MANDQPKTGVILALQQLGRSQRAVRVADAMKPETADAVLFVPVIRYRINARAMREACEESRIEHRNMSCARKRTSHRCNCRQRRRIVQRGEFADLGQ